MANVEVATKKVISGPVVYRRPKYSAEAKVFYYSAFGCGRRSFTLNIQPSVGSVVKMFLSLKAVNPFLIKPCENLTLF